MKALIFFGGWAGHEPDKVADVLAKALRGNGAEVQLSNTLDCLNQLDPLTQIDLIVPCWTMGKLAGEQGKNLVAAVRDHGVGIAGVHGGMGDAFREHSEYQFMVGGQFVAHPGGQIDYRVHIIDHVDPITADMQHFNVRSEQYYMHVDPSNHVLATTAVEFNGATMPVAWKRSFGKGRVFYSALGHVAGEFENAPVLTLITRGMLWAAEGKKR
jgi:hypothetical protein